MQPAFSDKRGTQIQPDFQAVLAKKSSGKDPIAYFAERFGTPGFNHRVDLILGNCVVLDCYPAEFWKPGYLLKIALNTAKDDFVATKWNKDDKSTWVG